METMRPEPRARPTRKFFQMLARSLREPSVISIVSIGGFLLVTILIVYLLGSAGILNLGFMYREWGTLAGPAWISLVLTIVSFVLGLALAMPLGLVRAYGPTIFLRKRLGKRKLESRRKGEAPVLVAKPSWPTRVRKVLLAPAYGLATGYVEGIRGTPFYVQMWIVFYLISFTWPRLPSLYFVIGLVALTISTVGYQAEILRAGFQSVNQGQIEAAKSIGMRGRQVFVHVTLPQALRLVSLPLANEWIGLFKTSSILNFVSVQELMFQAYELGSNMAHPIEAFVMVAVTYCAILIPLGRIVTYFERKRRIPGLGTPTELTRVSGRGRYRTALGPP
jgi:ABC-type amino acid transport system permease subunit